MLSIVTAFNSLYNLSFAHNTHFEIYKNDYIEELSSINTREDLEKSAQKAVKAGEIDTWIKGLASMPTVRQAIRCEIVNEKIYCIGGMISSGSFTNKVEVYDPVTNTWETKAPMPTARAVVGTIVFDEKIYCIGGTNGTILNKVEVYDPATNTWETKASMPTARSGLAVSEINRKIYCIGGYNGSSRVTTVEVYDPATNTWETKTSMPTPRNGLAGAVIDGKIYIAGGHTNSGRTNILEVYNSETDSWETKASMPTSRMDYALSVVNRKLYYIGGSESSSSRSSKVEVYNPTTNTWETKTPMFAARSGMGCAAINGKIYCFGGNAGSAYTNTVEAYVASTSITIEDAERAIDRAKFTKYPDDLQYAKELVKQLPESDERNELLNKIDRIIPKTSSSNIDVYIVPSNILSLSLSTNVVTFKDVTGTEDVEMKNAMTLTVESNLPYEINSSLESKISNPDGSEILDASIVSIKASDNDNYKDFIGIGIPITILDVQQPVDANTHVIDLRLNTEYIKKVDVYKTVIKFEVNQK